MNVHLLLSFVGRQIVFATQIRYIRGRFNLDVNWSVPQNSVLSELHRCTALMSCGWAGGSDKQFNNTAAQVFKTHKRK